MVILLVAVLGAVAGYAAEATSSYTLTVFYYMVILVALEALHDIAAAVKQLAVVELAV
jgi:hypothetical protein